MSYPNRQDSGSLPIPDASQPSDTHPTPSSQQAPSPLDWANFMNFQTPPVSQAGPAGNGMPHTPGYGGKDGNNNQAGSQGQGRELYGFAQGVQMNQGNRQSMSFQAPPYTTEKYQQPPQSPRSGPSQSSGNNGNGSGNGNGNGKGKSPANQPHRQLSGSLPPPSDGLSLDPAAFSRDIRFQIPSFLSNPVGGAPTFPPGGEAWSGFGAPSLSDSMSGFTPGQLFGNMFNTTDSSSYNNGGGWGGDNTYGGGGGGGGGGSSAGYDKDYGYTTFYVNPNPASSNLRPGPSNYSQKDVPSPRNTVQPIPQQQDQRMPSPRTNPSLSSAFNHFSEQRRNNTLNPSTPASNSIATSALLPGAGSGYNTTFPYVPSISENPSNSASTINIASSSSAPYAPPSNTEQLLTAPVAPAGPSLADGPGLYSTTGFDMVGVLARVAARKDPKTVLGPVDFSCSFTVVDIRKFDSPIVYASPTFTALTGYELPQILGRNCRFLQSPDGEVVKGSKRKYTDNVAVAHLKRMLNAGKECQASLINYRRGGIPFINLVTVVPIPWEGTDIVYHVGFQVDLVEQPNAILRNMRDGSYQVNYTVSNPPQPPLRPAPRELGTTGLNQDVLDILGGRVNAPNFGVGEEGPKMDWLKMVLENSDDFIHVLSLKGLFQYVSPSVRRVLDYEPEDLLNKNISDICHPSDIVPLMRELKDSTHAPTEGTSARHVNLVFRIRHKHSGYVWIECTGRLHVEPGKGRKAVILSGRARSVPCLPWEVIAKNGGLAEKEFWVKLSYQGLILHATSTVSDVLGQKAEDLIGHSLFSILPGGDNGQPHSSFVDRDPTSPVSVLFNALQTATNGSTKAPGSSGAVMVTHKIVKRSGELIDVITILYAPKYHTPRSDDSDGNSSSSSDDSTATRSGSVSSLKPSSIVAQIKLLTSSVPNFLPSSSTSASSSTIANLTNARPIAHAGSSNLFEELETTRGTSWQYELHQLRLLNRRLKDDVLAARSVARNNALKGKTRKRKVGEEMGPPPTPFGPSMGHLNGNGHGGNGNGGLPEQYNAAPRHQLAPGFGLLNPNIPNPYF